MLAKLTSKNQVTIPKKIMGQLPEVQYFDVDIKQGVVIMKPLAVYGTDLGKIREKIKKLGIGPNTVKEALKWARSNPSL